MNTPLNSINQLHTIGLNERRSVSFDVGVIFLGGLFIWAMLILLLSGPDWSVEVREVSFLDGRILGAFLVLSLDPTGITQFVALAGVVLALSRFDRHSSEDLGMEDAVRLWTRLEFRVLIQFFLTLVAASAPYRAISWIILHVNEVGWDQQAAASAGTCIILWLLLLLAGPTSTFYGLSEIQRKWRVVDVLHKAGILERAWGYRWGQDLYDSDIQSRVALRIIGNWLAICGLSVACVDALGRLLDPAYQQLSDPQHIRFLILVGVNLGVLGFAGVLVGVGLALLSIKARNEGRAKGSYITRVFALAVPFLFATGTVIAVGMPYLPLLSAILLIGLVQLACIRGLLSDKPLTKQAWNPVRIFVQNLRYLIHRRAHLRSVALQARWRSAIEGLGSREGKKALKEARGWRASQNLRLPFLNS
ncbi:hypothetical protein [Pseudarthrobacter siccitolerans]|nr:hypothetical protein [Pseudarthrobacter siccitolerans]